MKKNKVHHVNLKNADLSSWLNSSMTVQKYCTCASLLEQAEYSVIDFNKVMSISGTP
jgi:hypothetical protein